RWTGDGTLEYLGRTDFQVKLRGLRIELGEIEEVLTGHPDVVRAAVVVRENEQGDRRLVAYVVPGPDAAVAEADVRAYPLEVVLTEYVRGRLPDYMVPAAVVRLAELPLTPTGKLDRQALPPEHPATMTGGAPRNSHEEKLCAMFRELLGKDEVGIEDDFFALGGHSLLATRLSARIREQFRIDMPVRTIIRYPTVVELGALVLAGGIPDEQADPFAVVLPLNEDPGTGKPPVWFFHSGGGLGWAFYTFAPHVRDRRVYAVQSRGFNGTDPLPGSVAEMVDDYIAQILEVQPDGPYHLAGWSYGGPVAHAVADALDRRGHQVALLAILDSQPASGFKNLPGRVETYYRTELEEYFGRFVNTDSMDRVLDAMAKVGSNNIAKMEDFDSPVYRGDVVFFNAKSDKPDGSWATFWRPHILGSIEEYAVDATHTDLHMPRPAAQIMQVIAGKLAR
ncbi:alpha/beta fold hydrolase, partial [Saccharomonospora sp. NPDC046836]|uniref:alpha/beta fold hydrolase n=1 Tax=Saccharomonospora sp. NPDC046836 TaxID=3156921 RepID=UPI00340675BC